MNGNTDTAVKLILQKMPLLQGHWLIVADENWYSVDWSAIRNAQGQSPQVVSNRFDIAQAAQTAGLKSDPMILTLAIIQTEFRWPPVQSIQRTSKQSPCDQLCSTFTQGWRNTYIERPKK